MLEQPELVQLGGRKAGHILLHPNYRSPSPFPRPSSHHCTGSSRLVHAVCNLRDHHRLFDNAYAALRGKLAIVGHIVDRSEFPRARASRSSANALPEALPPYIPADTETLVPLAATGQVTLASCFAGAWRQPQTWRTSRTSPGARCQRRAPRTCRQVRGKRVWTARGEGVQRNAAYLAPPCSPNSNRMLESDLYLPFPQDRVEAHGELVFAGPEPGSSVGEACTTWPLLTRKLPCLAAHLGYLCCVVPARSCLQSPGTPKCAFQSVPPPSRTAADGASLQRWACAASTLCLVSS